MVACRHAGTPALNLPAHSSTLLRRLYLAAVSFERLAVVRTEILP